MLNSRGNALFLILIAVALFAALAYAVTQSSRGGGTSSREQVEIDVALAIQQAAMIETTINRLLLTTNAQQVKFRNVPLATADEGNIQNRYYAPDGSTLTNVVTVGLFNPDYGLTSVPVAPIKLSKDTSSTSFGWKMFYNIPVIVNGVHAGTSLGDEILVLDYFGGSITLEACQAINKGLTGSTAILSDTVTGAVVSAMDMINSNGSISSSSGSGSYNIPASEGCFARDGGTRYQYFKLIRSF
jgi:hypothetical protein